MIQPPVRYDIPQMGENGPITPKDEFNQSKNQVKVSVQILSKENEKQPLNVAVQTGILIFFTYGMILFSVFSYIYV